jgi:hypothetical protein
LSSIRSSEFSCHLKEAPHTALSLIDPIFDPTGSCDVVAALTYLVRGQQGERQTPVVPQKFCERVSRSEARDILVFPSLTRGKIAGRADACSAELARVFRNVAGHGEDLIGVPGQEQVILTKTATAHLPAELPGLYVKRERIRKECPEKHRDLQDSGGIPVTSLVDIRSSVCIECNYAAHFLPSAPTEDAIEKPNNSQ